MSAYIFNALIKVLWRRPRGSQLSRGELGEEEWLKSLIAQRSSYITSTGLLGERLGWYGRRDKRPAFWGRLWWARSSDFHLPFPLWIWWVAVGIFWNPQSGVHSSLRISAFSKSFAFSYGEKLEDRNRAEWPKLLAVLSSAGSTACMLISCTKIAVPFLGEQFLVLKGWRMESRISMNSGSFASLVVLSRCAVVFLQ